MYILNKIIRDQPKWYCGNIFAVRIKIKLSLVRKLKMKDFF